MVWCSSCLELLDKQPIRFGPQLPRAWLEQPQSNTSTCTVTVVRRCEVYVCPNVFPSLSMCFHRMWHKHHRKLILLSDCPLTFKVSFRYNGATWDFASVTICSVNWKQPAGTSMSMKWLLFLGNNVFVLHLFLGKGRVTHCQLLRSKQCRKPLWSFLCGVVSNKLTAGPNSPLSEEQKIKEKKRPYELVLSQQSKQLQQQPRT